MGLSVVNVLALMVVFLDTAANGLDGAEVTRANALAIVLEEGLEKGK
jgi:hypothetical protein